MGKSQRVDVDADSDASPRSISQRRSTARREASAGYEQRRQKLLDAAAEVFKDKGLSATSVNDIAARMGADRATVYYYYGSKQEIYHDLIRQAVEQIVAIAEAAAVDVDTPATVRLRHLFEAILDGYERHYPYMHLFIQEDVRRLPADDASGSAALQGWVSRFEKAFIALIDDGIARGELRDSLDPHLAMFAMLGTINWSHRWFLPGGKFSGKELGAQFAEMFLEGIRAPRTRASRGRPKAG